MPIEFSRSASRHGISHERVRHAINHCPCPLYQADSRPDDEDLVVFLGPDSRGIPLEVVAIEQASGALLVIHAMRLRRKYAAAYVEVQGCP